MKKKWVGMTGIIMAVMMLAGCGAASKDSAFMTNDSYVGNCSPMAESGTSGEYYDSVGGMWDVEMSPEEMEVAEVTEEYGTVFSDRKLIRNVTLEVETKEYQELLTSLESQIQLMGGYIENMDSYSGSSYSGRRGNAYSSVTIRIPQEKLNSFLNTVSDICNVIRRAESVNDVTLSYVDMESHRDALRAEQSRLLELMEKVETLEDIMTLESRLTSVRYQIESMERQLRAMDNQVSYSTVYLNISEVKELTPVVEEEPTPWERIRDGFKENVKDITNGVMEFGIWFLIHIPQIVMWAVVILAIVLLFKRARKKRAARKAE